MNLHVLAIGKKKSEYDAMIKEYQKRVVAPFDLVVEVIQTDTAIEKINGSIEFKNVNFVYPDSGIQALKNISFKV